MTHKNLEIILRQGSDGRVLGSLYGRILKEASLSEGILHLAFGIGKAIRVLLYVCGDDEQVGRW